MSSLILSYWSPGESYMTLIRKATFFFTAIWIRVKSKINRIYLYSRHTLIFNSGQIIFGNISNVYGEQVRMYVQVYNAKGTESWDNYATFFSWLNRSRSQGNRLAFKICTSFTVFFIEINILYMVNARKYSINNVTRCFCTSYINCCLFEQCLKIVGDTAVTVLLYSDNCW